LEDIRGANETGVTHVIYGSRIGLCAQNNQLWDQQALPGVAPEAGDLFGWTLAVLKPAPRHHFNYFPFVRKVRR